MDTSTRCTCLSCLGAELKPPTEIWAAEKYGRLAALREVREMVADTAPAIQGDKFFAGQLSKHRQVIGIIDAMIAEEEKG